MFSLVSFTKEHGIYYSNNIKISNGNMLIIDLSNCSYSANIKLYSENDCFDKIVIRNAKYKSLTLYQDKFFRYPIDFHSTIIEFYDVKISNTVICLNDDLVFNNCKLANVEFLSCEMDNVSFNGCKCSRVYIN